MEAENGTLTNLGPAHLTQMNGGYLCNSLMIAPNLDFSEDDLDRQDMARLATGHDESLNDLMERHAKKLLHYLTRIALNEADAAELAEETFVRVYQNRARFDEKHKFTGWLYAIATNLARDGLRRGNRRPSVSLDAAPSSTGRAIGETLVEQGPNPSEALAAAERAKMVRQAVAGLPAEWRIPVVLSEYEGHSQSEIAGILRCSRKAVEMRLRRARQELRRRLADLLAEIKSEGIAQPQAYP